MTELDELLDQVLRGIGRNVLNLQKMEGMLKFVVASTGEIGSTDNATQSVQDLERSMKDRVKAIKRLPMGRLVEGFSKGLRPNQQVSADDAGRYAISVSFTFEDTDFTSELSHALEEIVRERNDLIHKRLLRFDPTSIESCRDLIRELDEQRSRIKPQFEALSEVCLTLREYFGQLQDYTNSDLFADDLSRSQAHELLPRL